MKNIAVITWKFDNYGTILQAYALNHYLNQNVKNVKCKLVNYELEKKNLDIPFRYFSLSLPHKVAIKVQQAFKILRGKDGAIAEEVIKRRDLFEEFAEQIPQTKPLSKNELKELNNDFDIFICGSDQIWNPNYFDKSYLLDFVSTGKKIAYAPSFGGKKIPFRLKNEYRKCLKSFACLSTREPSSCEIIEAITNRKCPYVVDPTLLLSKEQWINALNIKKNTQEKYILCYFLSDNLWYKKVVSQIKEHLKLPVIFIAPSRKVVEGKLIYPGPKEFVQLVNNAEYVITDSFHGTVFSVIMEKQFVTLQRFSGKNGNNENARLIAFLKIIGCLERFVGKENCELIDLDRIEFCRVQCAIGTEIEKSKKYLDEAINLKK